MKPIDKKYDRLAGALIDIALGDYSAKKCVSIAMKALGWKVVKPKRKKPR